MLSVLSKSFSKTAIFIFISALLLISATFLVRKKLTTVPPGGSCGGLVVPKYKWMGTLGLFPTKCGIGYICDYSNTALVDAPGTCKKIVLGETYSVGGNPLSWDPSATSLSFSEENLNVTILGFDDECEKYNPQQSLTGCVNAGKITWYIIAKKDNQKVKFSVSSERHGSIQKKELGYSFDFPEIDRFNLKLRVAR